MKETTKKALKRAVKVSGAVLVDIGTGFSMAVSAAVMTLGIYEKSPKLIFCGVAMSSTALYACNKRQEDINETGNYGLERR